MIKFCACSAASPETACHVCRAKFAFTELSAFATASCAEFGTTSSAACSYRAPHARDRPPLALSHHFFVSLRWRTTSRWSSSWRSSSAWREKSSEREVFIEGAPEGHQQHQPTLHSTTGQNKPIWGIISMENLITVHAAIRSYLQPASEPLLTPLISKSK